MPRDPDEPKSLVTTLLWCGILAALLVVIIRSYGDGGSRYGRARHSYAGVPLVNAASLEHPSDMIDLDDSPTSVEIRDLRKRVKALEAEVAALKRMSHGPER